jgi:hypothetical protein
MKERILIVAIFIILKNNWRVCAMPDAPVTTNSVNGLRPEQKVSMSLRTLHGVKVFDFQDKASFSGSVRQQVEVPAKGFYLLDVAGKSIKIIME